MTGLENVNKSIHGSSQPRHTLVLERIPATSAKTVQTCTQYSLKMLRWFLR